MNPWEDPSRKARKARKAVRGRWGLAVVTQMWPLRVQLPGDDFPVASTPICLCPTDIILGDTVWYEYYGRQLVVVARPRIALDEWTEPTFLNSWANYDAEGAGYEGCHYRRDGDHGEMVGLVKNATNPTGAIFNLPSGLRPDENHIFTRIADPGYARIDVRSTGDVWLDSYRQTGDASFVSLSGIRWPLGVL